jgi:predicted methyltransferase
MRVTAKKSSILSAALIAGGLSLAMSLGSVLAQGVPDFAAIIAAPDRAACDRDIDKRRDPVKLLAFTGVRTGMTVLDMGAGGAGSTELMARSRPSWQSLWSEPADLGARAKERFDARMQPAMKTVTSLVRPLIHSRRGARHRSGDVLLLLPTWHMEVDRAAMNRKLFAALRPGASLVITDHHAKAGEGVTVARTLHRIEEAVLRREVEAAGFKLAAEGDFLRHPEDARDFNVNRPTGPVDEFVLRFEKPR